MSKSNPGKHGFPVLAYLTPEPLSLSLTLRIQYHEQRKQVTLMLRARVSLHGADDEQGFVAQYDADNLVPDKGTATVYTPAARLEQIVRNPSSSQMTRFSLRLKHACPLWCPRMETLLPKPEPAHVEAFNELVQLAKATLVHLVFDYHWLNPDARVSFQRLVKGKEPLTGFPVADHYSRSYRPADWTVFGPELDSGKASNKRPRRVSSPLSSPPPYRRKIEHPEPPSPTELATSPPPVKSDGQDGHADDKSIGNEHDFQTLAITRVVKQHLPAILASTLSDALKQTLHELLPAMLPALFALPPSFSPSYEPSCSDSDSSQPSPPQTSGASSDQDLPPLTLRAAELTPLGACLLPHILAHLEPQLQKIHTRSVARGLQDWHRDAVQQFEDDVDDHKAELTMIREDNIGHLQQEVDFRLDELRHAGKNVADDAECDIENVGWATAGRVVRHVQRAVREAAKEQSAPERQPRGRRRAGKGGYRGVRDRKGCLG